MSTINALMPGWSGHLIAVCPITELGFLRVACALGSTMDDARTVLAEFLRDEAPLFIPCDRRALDSVIVASELLSAQYD